MTSQTNGTRQFANPVYKPENQCIGKRKFDSDIKAHRAAYALSKNRKGKRKVRHYLCTYCSYWHIGKMPVYFRGWSGHNESQE